MQLYKTIILIFSIFILTLSAGCSSTTRQESTGEFFDSSLITAKVKARLFDDPITGGFRIKVETYKGKVQLSGFVHTLQEKERAAIIARQIPGVVTIINDIVVSQ